MHKLCIVSHKFFHSGTKSEMDRLEDQFVAGSWAPPFLAPPRKKRKLLNKKQTTAATKKNILKKKDKSKSLHYKKVKFYTQTAIRQHTSRD